MSMEKERELSYQIKFPKVTLNTTIAASIIVVSWCLWNWWLINWKTKLCHYNYFLIFTCPWYSLWKHMVTGRGLIVHSFYFFDIVEQNFIGGTSSPELKDRLLNTQYIFFCAIFCLSSPQSALYETKGKVIVVWGL